MGGMWRSYLLAFCLSSVGAARDLDARFDKFAAKLGPRSISIYLADTEERRARGLMFVEDLAKDVGMLFAFERPQELSFWMKNTLIPLAIGFFDENCVLNEIVEMNVAASVLSTDVPTYRSARPAKFALEMNRGWFGRVVKPGAKLKLLARDKIPPIVQRCK